MKCRRFNISLPEDLLSALDKAAQAEFISRSAAYIREAVIQRINFNDYITGEIKNQGSSFNALKALYLRKSLKAGFRHSSKE